ncbi:hypothetical protein KC678_05870 [Candidatus Dojkabacteria bacterium]|uniref:Uncharacterized protein n=1 Tax=Candidatus Dojkabacteria bacterium TaxID=2099670 RepID=A0A955L2Q7_9BACT|nr:hypothetical protein [Candidatus Dojkabacteria bacterium]MCB1712957.1 hypothetical protein [Candidatus Riesia sp.]
MEESEFEIRFNIYKEKYCAKVSPPECASCHCEAEIYDTLDGENYCLEHLKESLMEDLAIFIENTN